MRGWLCGKRRPKPALVENVAADFRLADLSNTPKGV